MSLTSLSPAEARLVMSQPKGSSPELRLAPRPVSSCCMSAGRLVYQPWLNLTRAGHSSHLMSSPSCSRVDSSRVESSRRHGLVMERNPSSCSVGEFYSSCLCDRKSRNIRTAPRRVRRLVGAVTLVLSSLIIQASRLS